MIIPILPRCY